MSATTIAERVGELQQETAGKLPESVIGVFGAEQEKLVAEGVPEGAAAVGTILPDADLVDVDGSERSLEDALGEGLSVLVLYRGAWCPYCNLTLRAYQGDLLPALEERGVSLIAISPQTPDGSLSTQEKNDLSFTVLSDPGNSLAHAAGIITEPLPRSREAQQELGLDLTEVNADGTAELPMPTTMIVDSERQIRWIDVHPDYTTRSEPTEILTALDAAGR